MTIPNETMSKLIALFEDAYQAAPWWRKLWLHLTQPLTIRRIKTRKSQLGE